jgi:hypothetical protein
MLATAYARRKEWEARRLAVEIVKAIAKAMGGEGAEARHAVGLAEFERVAMGG